MRDVCLLGAAFSPCSVTKQPAFQVEGCRPSPWPKETFWHNYIKGCPCIDRQVNLRRNASCLEDRAVKLTACSSFLQISSLLLVASAAFKKTILVGTRRFLAVVYAFHQGKSHCAFAIPRFEAGPAPFPALYCCQLGRLLPVTWAVPGCGTRGMEPGSLPSMLPLGCPS